MSHNCNFFSWVMVNNPPATNSSSAPKTKNSTHSNTTRKYDSPAMHQQSSRRASSSEDLNQPVAQLLTRSSSGHHLAIGNSVETVCGDRTNPNRPNKLLTNVSQPLTIEIDSPVDESENTSLFSAENDILLQQNNDLQEQELEELEKLRELEREAEYWAQIEEAAIRKQYRDDVPRTLVENIIKLHKEIREFEIQDYNQRLREQCLYHDDRGDLCFDETRIKDDYEPGLWSRLSPSLGKFGSHIEPGQENTADILSCVPPSGSLQYRQYLSKASSELALNTLNTSETS
jgi:hypothetical protein